MNLQIFNAIAFFLFKFCLGQEAIIFNQISRTEILERIGFINEFSEISKVKCLNRCRLSELCAYVSIKDDKCRLYDSSAAKYPSFLDRSLLYKKTSQECHHGVCPIKKNLYVNLTYHSKAVRHMVYLKNGSMASASNDIAIWSLSDFSFKTTLIPYNTIIGLEILPNNDLVSVISNGTILIWNTYDLKVKKSIIVSGGISEYAIKTLPNGFLAIGQYRNNSVLIIDPEDPGSIKMELFGHANVINDFAILKDNLLASSSMDCNIIIWNLTSQIQIQILSSHTLNAYKLAVLPNGDLVSAGWDNLLLVWNISDWTIKLKINTQRLIYALNVLSDGHIISGQQNGTIFIWDSKTGDLKTALNGHTKMIRTIQVISSDIIISGSNDNLIKLWYDF